MEVSGENELKKNDERSVCRRGFSFFKSLQEAERRGVSFEEVKLARRRKKESSERESLEEEKLKQRRALQGIGREGGRTSRVLPPCEI